LRGDPSIGCVRLHGDDSDAKSKLYCFASWEALDEFASDPLAIGELQLSRF